MTHDELKQKLEIDFINGMLRPSTLMAVVELHKSKLHNNDNKLFCIECSSFSYRYVEYPCPTIQAIEKELK